MKRTGNCGAEAPGHDPDEGSTLVLDMDELGSFGTREECLMFASSIGIFPEVLDF